MEQIKGLATYARVYLGKLKDNIAAIKGFIKEDTLLCLAVKANAYGHGAVEVARSAIEAGVDYFAVARVSEGVALREGGISLPIMLLSLCNKVDIPQAVKYNLEPLVADSEYINFIKDEAQRQGVSVGCHLAVDTGMGRIGVLPLEAGMLAREVVEGNGLRLKGVCTHFSCADSLSQSDIDFTAEQFRKFTIAIKSVKDAGLNPGLCHCCNSAGIFNLPQCHLGMVRLGISAYGYYPGEINEEYLNDSGRPCHLEPVMALCSTVSAVREVKEWASVSYAHEWVAPKDTHMAVLPVGYADGLLRRWAPYLQVAISGKSYPVRGRICMDVCMVDTGDVIPERYSEAVIFGPKSSGAVITACDIADAVKTIPYEVLCCISSRVPRVYQ